MQDLMKRVQEAFFRVRAQEAQRERAAEDAAGELGCKPVLSAIAEAAPERDRSLLISAGERLGHAVFALKAEMAILNGLIEQNERYTAMLLSEWRRLEGAFTRASGLDFRG
jgi:hypothetical protein